MQMPNTVNQDKADATKVVMAGMKVMYDKNVFPKFIAGFKHSTAALPDLLAAQAAGLIKILDDQSKGTIPRRILVPAAVILMIEMADFLRNSKMANPSPNDISQAIKKVTAIILKVYSAQQQQPPQQPAQPAQPAAMQPPAAPQGIINQGMQ